ncbi:kinase-like domain-containing protein [Hypoxylon cercidicola]|nr:kinase-like domain-containing protein [Hypoxylon cercidicola]
MGDSKLYLPPRLSETSIRELLQSLNLPEPGAIGPLNTIAEYHSIYVIDFPPQDAAKLKPARTSEPDWRISLVLRVSGKHLPRIKTLNEVAAMSWVKKNTEIPIPTVIAFDASDDNPIRHEFTLLEKVPGVSVDTIYDSLDDAQKKFLVRQLTEYLIELRRHGWNHAGGLSMDPAGNVVPGRIVAENFFQAPEIAEYWGINETIHSLNPNGPFDTYTSYMRGVVPRLLAFNSLLDQWAGELNVTRYILTQRDLHFGNVMCDPSTAQITSILDWEFAVVLPLPLWTPGGGFLWNGQHTTEGLAEQRRLCEVFEQVCAELDPALLGDFEPKLPHDNIKKILNYVRAIVEVCPRGQKADAARDWWKLAEETLSKLGV